MKRRHKLIPALLILISIAAALTYLKCLDPARFGWYHDDGIYAVTAKALATGKGYRIISLPDEPAQTKYPPLYPLLLSLIWRAVPNFPKNLPILMSFSVLVIVFFLLICYAYFVRRNYADPWTALIIVALMAFNCVIIVISCGLLSEPLFMLISLLALWAVERSLDDKSLFGGVIAGVLLGLSFLTRAVGIALLVATGIFLLLKRAYKPLLVILLVGTLFVAGWFYWQLQHHAHKSTSPLTSYYTDYAADFNRTTVGFRLLPRIVSKNFVVFILFFPAAVSLSLTDSHFDSLLYVAVIIITLCFLVMGFSRRWVSGAQLPDLYVASYLSLLVFWPYPAYDRFLLALLPFLLLYLTTEAKRFFAQLFKFLLDHTNRKTATVLLAVIMAPLALQAAHGYTTSLKAVTKSQKIYRDRMREEALVTKWVREHTRPSDVLLSYRDPVVYLYTGRHSVRSVLPSPQELYVAAPASDLSSGQNFLDIVRDHRADYLILTASDFELESRADSLRSTINKVVAESPTIFEPVYHTPNSTARIYRIKQNPLRIRDASSKERRVTKTRTDLSFW